MKEAHVYESIHKLTISFISFEASRAPLVCPVFFPASMRGQAEYLFWNPKRRIIKKRLNTIGFGKAGYGYHGTVT